MEKINICELLKDCPKGMKLDCTMYDSGVQLVTVIESHTYPIKIQTPDGVISLTKDGCYSRNPYCKCIIFPKGKTTWEGFQKTFKNGDVLYIDCNDNGDSNKLYQYIFMLKEIIAGKIYCYCYIDEANACEKFEICCLADQRYNPRFATEEEKQKLFDAIKANGYKWNNETKTLEKLIVPKFKVGDKVKHKNLDIIYTIKEIATTLYYTDKQSIFFEHQDNWDIIEKFDITTLKAFDKVLTRDNDKMYWSADIYSHHLGKDKNYQFRCISVSVKQCIPYEENKHLLGTTNDCDDYYKTW